MQKLTTVEAEVMETGGHQKGVDLFDAVFRHKWIIALCVAVSLGLGYLYYSSATPIYQSSAKVVIIKKQSQVPDGAIQTYRETDDYVSGTHLATQMEIIRGRKVIKQAIDDGRLDVKCLSLREPAREGPEVLTSHILGNLSIDKGGKGRDGRDANTLTVKYAGPNPEDCAEIVNQVVESYQAFLKETSSESGQETLKNLTSRLDKSREALANLREKYATFSSQAPLIFPEGSQRGSNIHQQELYALEESRIAVKRQVEKYETLLKRIRGQLDEGTDPAALLMTVERSLAGNRSIMKYDRQWIEPNSISHLSNTLHELERQLDTMLNAHKYKSTHPKVERIRQEIEATKKQLQSAREEYASTQTADLKPEEELRYYLISIEQELAILQEDQKLIMADHDAAMKKAKDVEDFRAERNQELAKIQTQENFVNLLTEQVRQLRFNDESDSNPYETRVISQALPGTKIKPRLLHAIGIAGFFGFFCGAGLGYLIELADKSFRTPEDVRSALGWPLVGQIPLLPARKSLEVVDETAVDATIRTFHRPLSQFAEAYRAVRTSLYFSTRGEGHKVIQITSPVPGDGKSTLAANVAVAIAQSGKKILLVDADFRKPRVHVLFNAPHHVGMSSVIDGEAELDDAIQATDVDNLSIMPCGPIPPNPSELLTSPRFAELLQLLRERFDFVIVDTPPLLAVTDPSAVAPRVDGVILTMRLRKNARPLAMRAKDVLENLGVRVLGVVVAGVSKQGGYGYGYGYGYGDGSYYADDQPQGRASRNRENGAIAVGPARSRFSNGHHAGDDDIDTLNLS